MITPAGLVKVLDFAVERIREAPDSGDEQDHAEPTSWAEPTPALWWALHDTCPEQARGESTSVAAQLHHGRSIRMPHGHPHLFVRQKAGEVAAPFARPDISSELDRVVLALRSRSNPGIDAAAMRRELPRPKSPGAFLHSERMDLQS
jgi:hypothetical protein